MQEYCLDPALPELRQIKRLRVDCLACKMYARWMTKEELTLKEFRIMGGHARANKLSKERRVEIARKASLAAKKAKEDRKNEKSQE